MNKTYINEIHSDETYWYLVDDQGHCKIVGGGGIEFFNLNLFLNFVKGKCEKPNIISN